MAKRPALGKGLGALIPDIEKEDRKNFFSCGIEEITPSRYQPRKGFDEGRLTN